MSQSPGHDELAAWAAALAPRPRIDPDDRGGGTLESPVVLEPESLPWGPPLGDGTEIEVAATWGSVELEYASLHRSAGVMDEPQRATIVLRGAERLDFLDRMLTQAVGKLEAGTTTEAFLLDRKGRIVADMVVVAMDDRTILLLDAHQVAAVHEILEQMVFLEEIVFEHGPDAPAVLAVHGPSGPAIVAAAAGAPELALEVCTATSLTIDGAQVVVLREDRAGVHGLTMLVARSAIPAIVRTLRGANERIEGDGPPVRPVGWYAVNMARVEAGRPLFNIDFGDTNLPHETGMVHRRVSFNKGCYPGQEVVARIEHLGRPKQIVVRLHPGGEGLPIAGGQVLAAGEEGPGDVVGTITSSAPSPMAGSRPVALAMVRTSAIDGEGATVRVAADGELTNARVEQIATES